jgi:hypothetical protein
MFPLEIYQSISETQKVPKTHKTALPPGLTRRARFLPTSDRSHTHFNPEKLLDADKVRVEQFKRLFPEAKVDVY